MCTDQDRVALQLCQVDSNGNCLTGADGLPNHTHYVFVSGQTPGGSDWNVFDPGWQNANPAANLSTLNGHLFPNGGFTTCNSQGTCTFRQYVATGVRTYEDVSSLGNSGAFSATANSPVELALTDPVGRQLGDFNGVDTFGIPNGSYTREFPFADDTGGGTANGDLTGIKTAHVPFPVTGTYEVTATGTALGSYTLTFVALTTDGATQVVTESGVAGIGSTTTYQSTYSTAPGSTLTVTLMATFTSTLADISNSLALGLIDSQGNANSVSAKINAASAAAGRGNYSAEANNLNLFISQVNALTGKHITGIAPQVLLADANSLLAQIP